MHMQVMRITPVSIDGCGVGTWTRRSPISTSAAIAWGDGGVLVCVCESEREVGKGATGFWNHCLMHTCVARVPFIGEEARANDLWTGLRLLARFFSLRTTKELFFRVERRGPPSL